MKSFIALSLAALAVAAPAAELRQEGLVFNDLVNGDCGDVVFIFARGSGESGNMVSNGCSTHGMFQHDFLHTKTNN